MGGKDDDRTSDLDKWVDAQRAELSKLRNSLRDNIEDDFRSWTEEATTTVKGPLERFKSFVDTNLSTLSDNFKKFPANITELKARMQQEKEARREEERDIWRRWTGSEDSPDHIRLQVDRLTKEERGAARDATYLLLRESFERNQHVDHTKIMDLYRDNEWSFGGLDQFATPMLSFGGACYYKAETVENLPSTARWGWPAPRPQWLSIDWFKRSPYSPIRLEGRPELEASGGFWRAAFEDLLRATLDKPLVSEERIGLRPPYGKPQSTYHGPGLDWMLSLQCRGILPLQLPALYRTASSFGGSSDAAQKSKIARFMQDLDVNTNLSSVHGHPMSDSAVKKDLELLIDEIAIQSGPDTSAEPLAQAVVPWKVPDTEQDLYDQWPPLTQPQWPWVPVMTGNQQDDQSEAEDALWEALHAEDATTAAKCLDAYYKAHGNVDDLVEEPMNDFVRLAEFRRGTDWAPLLDEALRQSSLPDSNFWKREACGFDENYVDEEVQDRDTHQAHVSNLSPDQEMQRLMLDRQDLERYRKDIEEIEEDSARRSKERDTRENSKHKGDEHAQAKRPDILSQLTTTQTTRMPDGTVTTKVVLKQRFADGREEEHESVHTSHEQSRVPVEQGLKPGEEQAEKSKKNGWFWN